MLAGQSVPGCCDRCPVPDDRLTRVADPAAVSRRRLLKAAVFPPRRGDLGDESDPAGAHDVADSPDQPEGHPASTPVVGFPDAGHLPRAVFGVIRDVSPQVLVLGDSENEQRFSLPPDAVAWRGAQLEPAALQPGDTAVIRLHPASRHVADRIWARIGRVTGIIVERAGNTLLVKEGETRPPAVVVIQPRAVGRIQVRFPTLEPGYLVDIIGLRRDGELEGIIPATSQPAYPATRLPAPILASGRMPDALRGSATWHEPRDEPAGVLGLSYPALDPDTGCVEDSRSGYSYGYARMPYLALGSVLRVHNECTDLACTLPVTACAPIARLFNDRCVTCGTSPRGRIADLTMASFVALGGDLDRGCFNATITMGE